MTTCIRRRTHLQGLVILIACTGTLACVQKPVVPSDAARVPINSDEMIHQYRERVKSDQREKQERSLLTKQMESLTQQVQELGATLTLVQLQQQELAKGKSRSGYKMTPTALTINPLSPESKGPLTSAPLSPDGSTSPPASDQSLTRIRSAQSEEERSTSVGPACSIGPSVVPSPPSTSDTRSAEGLVEATRHRIERTGTGRIASPQYRLSCVGKDRTV